MALFKVFRGLSTELNAVAKTDGHAYFCTDDGSFWIDYKDSNNVLQRKQVNATDLKEKITDAFSVVDDNIVNLTVDKVYTGKDEHECEISGFNFNVAHGKLGPGTSISTTAKYTSGNITTSISGYSDSKTIKIPQITVDEYGHVTSAGDESVTITMPAAQTIPTSFNITAEAADDNVVDLTAEGGANKVKYTASHAKKGPTNGYTSGNTTTSFGGSGTSTTIKIPQLTVDSYGHVTAATDENVVFKMPTAADLGLTGALIFLGVTETVIFDGSESDTIIINNEEVTAQKGNVVLYNNKEFLWNNGAWEELGDEGSYALKTVQVIGGDGLYNDSSNPTGELTKDVILHVGEGEGIAVSDNEVAHAVPSGASSGARGTNNAGNYIRTITTDKFGHVTGVTSDAFDINDHYTPATDSTKTLSVDASSSTAATWGSTDLVTGVNIQRDAKGHVTGVTVDSIQMPANPNTDTKVTAVGNHYTPSGTETLSADAEAQSTNGTFYLVSGINVNRDAKGHTTSVSVDSVSDVKITTSTDASGNKVVTFS